MYTAPWSFAGGFRASCGEWDVARFFPFPPADEVGVTGVRGCDIARTLLEEGPSGILLCFVGRGSSSEGAFRFREAWCCGCDGPKAQGRLASQDSMETADLDEGEFASFMSAYMTC